ncbi:DUF5593 domain-containing protein [Rhodococcus erythropolis]|jgi:hypothetical protein|uniref:GAF domain-containing protein n=1 Tax=Rhodococcus TaxID=1827 RepID=UPI001AE85BB9|nr:MULTISPECIES: GAF domain-containing protein [Rhodococcus]MBP2520982.1 hypothetical protein [Rhodococcus sp. PvP104]MBY6382577.1 DUF5593 domain-containing protein [Rhodococcus erythropolis]MBY6389551.1 DUF5593 domain-containing protein [Rhodococcus erythropolis]
MTDANASTASDWLLIETIGESEPLIVAKGLDRQSRKLRNTFRGALMVAAENLVRACVTSGDEQRESVEGAKFGDSAIAIPVHGANKAVVAVQLWIGFKAQPPTTPPEIGVWDWELDVDDVPPRLLMSPAVLRIFGVSEHTVDRSVFGPADFFTRFERLSDIVRMLNLLHISKPGEIDDGTFIARTAESRELKEIRYFQRCVDTDAGRRLRGLSWDITSLTDAKQLQTAVLDTYLVGALAGLQGTFGAVGDMRYPNALYIIKWLTPHVPGIGHGVSTGQTPGIHPDDWPQIHQWMSEVRDGPVSGLVRARKGGGGYLKMRFSARLLDPAVSDTIGLALFYPDGIETVQD